jgi:hypothetical protein
MFILIKKDEKKNFDFKLIDTDLIKMGTFKLANKGCIYVRFKINNESIIVFNCHLPSGKKEKS